MADFAAAIVLARAGDGLADGPITGPDRTVHNAISDTHRSSMIPSSMREWGARTFHSWCKVRAGSRDAVGVHVLLTVNNLLVMAYAPRLNPSEVLPGGSTVNHSARAHWKPR